MFKFIRGYGMYNSVDFSNQIVVWRGSLVPQTRVSHTPIGVWLGCDLKNRLLLLLLLSWTMS
jgi:hypothetical protein